MVLIGLVIGIEVYIEIGYFLGEESFCIKSG